jgi:hypothetical protein
VISAVGELFPPAQQARYCVFLGFGWSEIAFCREIGHFLGANFCRLVVSGQSRAKAQRRNDAGGCGGTFFWALFFENSTFF